MRRWIDVYVVAPTLYCWGLEKLVDSASDDLRLIGSSTRLADAAHSLQRLPADVLLVDFDAVPGVGPLQQARLRPPVILLVPEREEFNCERWASAGVRAVLPKRSTPAALLAALRDAADHGPSVNGGVAPIRVRGGLGAMSPPADGGPDQSRIDKLTARERQLVLAVVCNAGTPGKVLAHQLCISEHTLRNHLTSIYDKLGVQNRLSLHAFALRHHLESDPEFLRD